MSISELVDEEVMRHLDQYGCIKNADPMVQHLVKTSNDPLLRFRRNWIRREALRQTIEGTRNQVRYNSEFSKTTYRKGASMRQDAVFDPYLAESMKRHHKAELNDKDFIAFIRREEPKIFPRREAV